MTQTLRARRATTLRETWVAQLPDHVEAVAISPDGSRLAAAAVSGPIHLFDAGTGERIAEMAGHTMGTTTLAWRPDGRILTSGGQDGTVRQWDGVSGAAVAALEAGGPWVAAVAWSDDGKVLATAAGRELRTWTTEGGSVAGWTSPASSISDLGWKPGSGILAASGYGGITLMRPGGDKPPRVFEWKGSVLVLAWSPDGRFIATGDQDSTVHFWYAQRGTDLQMWGYETKVRELSWDPTSRYLATGGGQEVVVWDCSGKGPKDSTPRMLKAHESFVSALAWQHSGPMLTSGGYDGLLVLWSPSRSKKPAWQVELDGVAACLAWSPDDRWVVSGTSMGTILRLDLA